MKAHPFVSICLATYNRPKEFADCFNSLINQDYPKEKYEIIVVEDGSHSGVDQHIEKLKSDGQKPKAYYFWQENSGPGPARNLAVSKAKGEIIAFTDDDTIPPINWLSSLVKGFSENTEVAAVGGIQEEEESELKRNPYARYESWLTREFYGAGNKSIKGGFEVPTGGTNNIAYKKVVLDKYGTFDPYFKTVRVNCSFAPLLKLIDICGKNFVISGEDPDLKKRICMGGEKFLYIPLKVVHKREFNLKGLARQSWTRGIGIIHFAKKHKDEHMPTKQELYLALLKLPLATTKASFILKDKALIWPQFIDRLFTIKGQLDYNRVVGKI